MTKIVTFNGIDLSHFFRVTDIIRPVGNKRSISSNDAPSIGVNIQRVNRAEKIHTIKFDMRTTDPVEMERLKHELAGILNVLEPVKITYSDEPDKYYLGLPYDDIEPDNLTRWFQRSQLKIIIPDGVAHSTDYKTFSNPKVESSKMTFDLVNNGSVDAQPIITVKHNSENGYIGLVNQTGILEVGDRQEQESRASEILLNFSGPGWVEKALSTGARNAAILNDNLNVMNSKLGNNQTWNVDHLALEEDGYAGSGNKGASTMGASISWEIPEDSTGDKGSYYEYLEWVERFMVGHVFQMGYIKVAVSDENDEFMYGVETYKKGYGIDVEYNFLISDGQGGYQLFPNRFSSPEGNANNPFNREKGVVYIRRKNNVVDFYFDGNSRSIQVPAIKDRKSKKIHVYFGEVGSAERITFMYIERLLFRKDYSTSGVPNRYRQGSNVVMDCEKDIVTVDNLSKNIDVVQGSNFITIPPGKSQLEVYCSSWVTKKPTVEIKFEERYL